MTSTVSGILPRAGIMNRSLLLLELLGLNRLSSVAKSTATVLMPLDSMICKTVSRQEQLLATCQYSCSYFITDCEGLGLIKQVQLLPWNCAGLTQVRLFYAFPPLLICLLLHFVSPPSLSYWPSHQHFLCNHLHLGPEVGMPLQQQQQKENNIKFQSVKDLNSTAASERNIFTSICKAGALICISLSGVEKCYLARKNIIWCEKMLSDEEKCYLMRKNYLVWKNVICCGKKCYLLCKKKVLSGVEKMLSAAEKMLSVVGKCYLLRKKCYLVWKKCYLVWKNDMYLFANICNVLS